MPSTSKSVLDAARLVLFLGLPLPRFLCLLFDAGDLGDKVVTLGVCSMSATASIIVDVATFMADAASELLLPVLQILAGRIDT